MRNQDLIVKIENLSKIYGKGRVSVTAIDQINLNISNGEFVVIMGPSGSGKTTLIQLIGGLLSPSLGNIIVEDKSLAELNNRALAKYRLKEIGIIFQNSNLLADLTSIENVELPMNLAGIPRKLAKKKAFQLLEVVGLVDRLYHKPNQLSRGEKQRVGIARAMANDPRIILADEPTGNLDRTNGRIINQLLSKLQKQQQKTIIIVTHDQTITEMADRVLWIEDGKIVAPQEF